MDIVKENIDDLNAVVKIKIGEADYAERYDKALKRYQKKVDLPGFRPGKVPVGMVKQRFGKHILVEEINDLLSESIHKYLQDNKIDILGNPLPKDSGSIDFDKDKDFEFQYEVGLAPKLDIQLSSKDKFPYYTIKIDDALIDQNIEHMRRNYGGVIHPEVSEEKDVLVGEFTEVDGSGQIVPGGIFKSTLIAIEKLSGDENRKKLTGLKKEDKVILSNLENDAAYLFEILEIPADKVKGLSLQFTLKNLSRIQLAELNQEFFDRIYGQGKVNSMEEFRNKMKEEISVMHTSDSDRKFMNEVVEALMKKANISLPEDFLKRFLYLTNQEKKTKEEIEKEFDSYSGSLKWQILENYLLKSNNLAVTSEEVERYVSDMVKMSYAQRGIPATDEQIKEQVKKFLSEEKQVRNAYDRLYDQKLIDLFKKTFTIEKKEVPFDEFYQKSN